MSDKKKTLQEALAEVQRNAELKRIQETKAMWNNASELDEGLWSSLGKMARGAKPKKPINPMPHGGEKLTPETPKGRQGPETIDLKANKPSAPSSASTPKPVTPSKVGKLASNLIGGALGVGAGTVVGDKLANKLKNDTSTASASETTPPSTPTSVTPTQEPAKQEAPKQTFAQAFAAARKTAAGKGAKSTGQFEYQGKKFQTNIKGEKYVPMAKQTKVDIGTKVSEPSSTKPETPETPQMQPTKQSSGDSYVNREPGWRDTPPQPAPTTPKQGFSGSVKDTTPIGPSPDKFTKPQTESGGKKKMSESNSLINAFLKLQETKAANMFEAAKKMKKLDPVGDEDDDIDNNKKVNDADRYLKHRREVIAKNIKEGSAIGPKGSENVGPAVTSSPKGYVDPSTPTKPYQKAPMSTKAGEIISKAKGAAGMKEETVEEGIADVVKTGAQVAKNFAANVRKGYAGTTGNVTRNITPVTTKTATRPVGSTFAKPGGASKAGEAVGSFAKSANALADKPVAATIGAGALAGAAMLGANTPKFTKPDTTSSAPAPAPKPSAPAPANTTSVKPAPAPKPAAPSASAPLPPKRPLEVGKTFGQTFSAARQKAGGAGGEFEYKGKSYSTRMKGEKPVNPLKKVEEEIINEIGISKALQKKGYAIHGVGKHDNEFEVMRYNKDGTAKELSGYETDLRKAKHVANRDDNQEKKKNKKVQEEVLFSEEELAHFNSVLETASVSPSDSGETVSNTVSDTSPRRTLTDSKKAK